MRVTSGSLTKMRNIDNGMRLRQELSLKDKEGKLSKHKVEHQSANLKMKSLYIEKAKKRFKD